MNLLSIEHLSKSYSRRQLFDDMSFFLQEGEKVGIIGINGTGKSTLLKIMAGLEETDEGTVTKANHAVIAYLPQHPVFDPERTALDCVLAGHRELSGSESGQAEEGDHQDEAALVTKAKTMLTKLGVSNFDQKSGELSGGQRKRLALVSVLLKEADILLLDEPTNHLDHEMADWLEEQLKQRKEALVMITHDRYFLDSVCNRIAEVDKGKLYSYDTNYAGYLELKAQREEMAQATELKRQNILRTELAWVQRGARARSTKQKARLERYEELKNRKAPETDGQVELGSISTRLGTTESSIPKSVIVRTGAEVCKALPDGGVLHRRNPKPFHRLLAACQLIDTAEDQLALASGIASVYHLRHIRGIHQLFENIKLLFLILSHHHLPMFRQDRQVIISPLGVLGVIGVCIRKTGQMAHAPADTPAVALQIPVLTGSCADLRSQTLGNRRFFSDYQLISHLLHPPILPAQACAVFSLCCFPHPTAGYNRTGSHSGTVSPKGH